MSSWMLRYPFYYTARVAGYYNFFHACKHHDGCYHYHWASRATCDLWFKNDMYASCTALRSNDACCARANLYYAGVRAFGEFFWQHRDIRIAMNYYI